MSATEEDMQAQLPVQQEQPQQVTIEQPRPSRPQVKMNPWVAALGYGLPIAAVAGGPIGLAIGAAFGLIARAQKNDWLEREKQMSAYAQENFSTTTTDFQREIEQAEQQGRSAHKELLERMQTMYNAAHEGFLKGDQSRLADMQSISARLDGMLAADDVAEDRGRERIQTAISGLTTSQAGDLRVQHQEVRDQYARSNENTQKALEMLNGIEGDDVSPETRAALLNLYDLGVAGGYRNSRGVLQATAEGLGGKGGKSEWIALGVDVLNTLRERSQDWKKADYYKAFLDTQAARETYTKQALGEIEQRSNNATARAQKYGVLPKDFSVWDYVSGGTTDLPMLSVRPAMTREQASNNHPITPLPELKFGSAQTLSPVAMARFARERERNRRPTNR